MIVLLIGKLEQLHLSSVLRRVEMYAKTGLMHLKQGERTGELYFHEGQLMYVRSAQTNATLGEQLLQDGLITFSALEEAIRVIGDGEQSEACVAQTLIKLEYLNKDELRAWATKKATTVLHTFLSWSQGELYFEEDCPPPACKLFVSLSISSLLSAASQMNAQSDLYTSSTSSFFAEPPMSPISLPAIRPSNRPAHAPSPISIATLIPTSTEADGFDPIVSPPAPRAPQSSSAQLPTQLVPASSATGPVPPKSIDTSFMHPDMVLKPANLSALKGQEPQVQVTPDQWRLLTRVDGMISLGTICQELAMTPGQICQIVGELLVEGVVEITQPVPSQANTSLPAVTNNLTAAGLNNGYTPPGYAIVPASPRGAALPTSDVLAEVPSLSSLETQSQWGNGGNGAKFVPGRGWIAAQPQPLQPLQSSGPLATISSGMYASVGRNR